MILYTYVPGQRLIETWPAYAAVSRVNIRYPVTYARCLTPTAYSEHVRTAWVDPVTTDLILVEQDMGPTVEMIEDFLTCPEPACAQVYWLSPASNGLTYPTLSAWTSGKLVAEGDSHADYSAIGLCRIAKRAREIVPNICKWNEVEGEINRCVSSFGWHLHWPIVKHYHGFREGDYGKRDYRPDTASLVVGVGYRGVTRRG